MKHFLIVVDMQNDFVDGALGSENAVKIVENVTRKIQCFDGTVIATLDTHGDDYLDTQEGKKLPVKHCIKGTEGFELNRKVMSALEKKEYTLLEKPTFASVELPRLISRKAEGDAFTIELVGLCTDICVVSNALLLKANFPEAEISVNSACCAGVTEESHNAALMTMKSCQINII